MATQAERIEMLENSIAALTQGVTTLVNSQAKGGGRSQLEDGATIAEVERGKDGLVRLTQVEIKGNPWVSIRLFRYNREGDLVADGKRGITLRKEECEALGIPTE